MKTDKVNASAMYMYADAAIIRELKELRAEVDNIDPASMKVDYMHGHGDAILDVLYAIDKRIERATRCMLYR